MLLGGKAVRGCGKRPRRRERNPPLDRLEMPSRSLQLRRDSSPVNIKSNSNRWHLGRCRDGINLAAALGGEQNPQQLHRLCPPSPGPNHTY